MHPFESSMESSSSKSTELGQTRVMSNVRSVRRESAKGLDTCEQRLHAWHRDLPMELWLALLERRNRDQ